jgi:hypothetical protein
MTHDTASPSQAPIACAFTWCNGHDEWNSRNGDDTPWREHVTRIDAAPDVDRAEPSRAVEMPEVYALVTMTEHRTPSGAIFGQPRIRLEATQAELGPAAARELAAGLTALADALENIDSELAAR